MYQDDNDNYGSNSGIYSGYQPYMNSTTPGKQEPPKKPEKKKGKFFSKAVASIAFGLFFGLSAGVSFYAVKAIADYVNPPAAQTEAAVTVEENGNNAASKANEAITTGTTGSSGISIPDVVEKAMPSVVSITNEFIQKQDIFGQTFESKGEGSGSGIIIGESDTELLIATNYHVIAGTEQLSVQFIDGEQVAAQVKGTDSPKDLAVIAVQLQDIGASTLSSIAIAEMGDSDSLRVGETAIAIGNALGYGQSVTTGVISAVNREVQMDDVVGTFIQTNAAINPGNSGGALLNEEGQVIGINSNKIGGTSIEGMGYAIPISSAKPIIENLMTKTTRIKVDELQKGYLGIAGIDVTAAVTSSYGIPEGVYVEQVYENTPAEAAGIVKGNIITRFDGSTVTGMTELKSMLDYYAAGTSVEITVMEGSPSGYTEKTLTLVLDSKEEAEQ